DDVGVEPRAAGAAGLFGDERQRETALLERAPELVGPRALLGGLDQLLGGQVGEEARDGVGEQRAEIARAHRSPRPRAMMPRRISRVPPRSENDGAVCVM